MFNFSHKIIITVQKNIFYHIALAVCFLLPYLANAQSDNPVKKPKIGLVLSGGGAKGIAHIGVLKVLEQAGIKPDYITGTSMGSIIGGLYAMGYTADEISDLNRTTNWMDLLSDNLPLNKIVMEEKYKSDRYLFDFPIRNYHFKLPSGFREGQRLEAQFAELFWPLPLNQNFDSLPIPFRCYSVDLISGNTHEHKSGDISEAIRASMAIPSIFSPESIDSMLLVDGGVALNFPVQQVIDMGADIIIGVYVGTEENVTKEDLFSFSDVLGHTIFIGGIIDSKRQANLVDVLIEPDLKGLGSADFLESDLIEQYGNETAQEFYPQLKALADSLNLVFSPAKKVEKPNEIKVGSIQVQSLRFLKPDFVIGNSGIKMGESYSQQQLAHAVERLYGTKYFSKVTYKLEKRHDDYILVFNAIEKTRAFLKLAPNYANDRGVGVVTNLTLRNWGINSSHLILSLNIAENPAGRLEFTKYWGKRQRLMNFYYVNIDKDNLPYYSNGDDNGNYERFSTEAGIGLKYSMGLNSQIGIKAFYEKNTIKPSITLQRYTSQADFNQFDVGGFAFCSYYAVYTTDNLYFPTEGKKLMLRHKYTFNSNTQADYTNTEPIPVGFVNEDQGASNSVYGHYSRYATIFNHLTFNFGANVGFNSDNAGIADYYMLGGIHSDNRINYSSLAGFSFGEIIAKNYSSIHANLRLKIIDKVYFSLKTNAAFEAETIDAMGDFILDSKLNDYYLGYYVGVEIDSPLGPLRLMVGDNNQDGSARWNISLGYPF